MTGLGHQEPALDPDQQAALRALQAVFGTEQITVTDVQATKRPDPDPAPTQAAASQATLLKEEASCTSTCS